VVCAFVKDETTVSIPLTFDWLTLTWLKTRLHVWWRHRGRPAISLALLAVLAVLSGCVPVTRFEEAQSATQVELEGRRRAELEMARLQADNSQLRTEMQQQREALDERDQALSQAALDSTTQGKQRQEAEGMVEQLRGELARVGGHLQSYGEEKQKLAASLESESAHGVRLSRVARDATLLVGEPLRTGEYSLDAEPGMVVLRVPRADVLAEDGSVKPEASNLLGSVSRLLKLHPASKLTAYDSSAPADAIAVATVVAALGQQGVSADRIEPVAARTEPAPPASAEAPQIVMTFSVP
jgi:hypothetical protein